MSTYTGQPIRTVADSRTAAIGSVVGGGDTPIYPSELPIFGKFHPGYRFIEPVTLTIERDEDGSFVVSDDIFGIYGHAFTLREAVKDYVLAFVGYYELLSAHQDAPTVALFQELKRYFQPI